MGSELICPNCGSKDIRRIKRNSIDKVYSFLYKKNHVVKRYSCLACFWEGRIISKKESSNS